MSEIKEATEDMGMAEEKSSAEAKRGEGEPKEMSEVERQIAEIRRELMERTLLISMEGEPVIREASDAESGDSFVPVPKIIV